MEIKTMYGLCGEEGPKGDDGKTPYIGDNGNWWIDGVDTRKPSKGDRGMRGFTGNNGANGSDGAKGDTGEKGADGVTPHIGDNGNWWIGNTDTGVNASGGGGTTTLESKQTNISGDNFNNGTLLLQKIGGMVYFSGSFDLTASLTENTALANIDPRFQPSADRLIGVTSALGFGYITFTDYGHLLYTGGDLGEQGKNLFIHGSYFI